MYTYNVTFNCYKKGTNNQVTRQFTVTVAATSPGEAKAFGLMDVKAQYGQDYQNFEYVRCERA